MAEKTRTPIGEAVGMVKTAEHLQALPATSEALRRGELSGSHAKVQQCHQISWGSGWREVPILRV